VRLDALSNTRLDRFVRIHGRHGQLLVSHCLLLFVFVDVVTTTIPSVESISPMRAAPKAADVSSKLRDKVMPVATCKTVRAQGIRHVLHQDLEGVHHGIYLSVSFESVRKWV
jgi:hypothetical protein